MSEATAATFEPAWPLDKLVPAPDNPRRDLGDLTELAESIGAVGIVEPLVATTTDETVETGELLVVAGHRRLAAAAKAGLAGVPVMVHQQMEDKARREIMLVENVQRTDLLPIEEARTYQGLIELGYSQRELGRRIGRSQPHISRRLELLEFEKAAPSLADRVGVVALTERKGGKRDATGITIEATKELLKLKDHPGEIEKLVKAASDPEEIAELVKQRQRELEDERKIAQWSEEAAKKGWKVYTERMPSGAKTVSTGKTYEYDVVKVAMAAHRKEPCHAVHVVVGRTYYQATSRTEICLDPARHAKKGASELKAEAEPRRAKMPHEQAAADEAKAKKAAAARREEFLRPHVAKKPNKDEALDLLTAWVLDNVGSDTANTAAGLLGVERKGYRSELAEQARAAGDEVRFAVAAVLASGHFNARQKWHGWGSSSIGGLYDHLVAHGYELDEFEAAELEKARKEEARWQREMARAEASGPIEDLDEDAMAELRARALDALLIGHGEDERSSIEQLVLEMDVDELETEADARRCRTCGCTDAFGCDEGCSWVDEDLCSSCLEISVTSPEPGEEQSPGLPLEGNGDVAGDRADFDPESVKITGRGRKLHVVCRACEYESPVNTTRDFAEATRAAHLEAAHGLVPAVAS